MKTMMQEAIKEAKLGITKRDGGPFGAVVVREGKIIARGHNEVISSHDPTAHAEIVAIRRASKLLGRFDLSDCELYTTCEPCPMCFSAIHWAKIKRIYYGATKDDARRIGFDDAFLYGVLKGEIEDREFVSSQEDRPGCIEVFDDYEKDPDRTLY